MTGGALDEVLWPFKDEIKTDRVAYWVEMRQGLSEPYVGFVAPGNAGVEQLNAKGFSLVLSDQQQKAVNVSLYLSLVNLTDQSCRISLPACASCSSLSRRAH